MILPVTASAATVECNSCSDCSSKIASASSGDIIKLNTNITDSTTSYCINISTNNIIFDCQGLTIDANLASSPDYGIYVSRASQQTTNITIRNCTVSEWDTANIWFYRANGNNLTNIKSISSPDYGFGLQWFNSSTLENINVSENYLGIRLFNFANKNNFTNIIASNNSDGLQLSSSDYNNFTNIISSNNSDDGFHLDTSKFNTFTKITASNNIDDGFYLYFGDYNNFTNITISNNTEGFYLDLTSNVTFANSNVSNNNYGLIFFYNSDNNKVINSVFQNNSLAGIWLDETTTYDPENNTIYNCLLNNTKNLLIDTDIASPNFLNTTNQTGTRIYVSGTNIGGNYWTNSTGNGFSDTCTDAGGDGFCDDAYDMTNGTSVAVDWLPLSDEYIGCGYYVNENLNLDHDITGCTGTILYINASDVTLDCQNHYLQGSGSNGINNTGFNNVTIRNCEVNMSDGGGHGIYYQAADYGKMENNKVYSANNAIYLVSSLFNNVTNNTAFLSDSSLYLTSSDSNFIYQNNFTYADSDCVVISGSDNNTVLSNNITNSTTDGIYFNIGSMNNNISNNQISFTGHALCIESGYNKFYNNEIYQSMGSGTNVIGIRAISLNNWFENNTVRDVQGYGVLVYQNMNNNTFIGGSVSGSNLADYYIYRISTGNSFRSTNFTAARQIYFYDTASWFNYNNASTGGIWLNTSVSAQATLTRELTNWNQTLVQWNDTNTSGTGITATYNVSNLTASSTYYVYNNSVLAYSLQADSNGVLPQFSIPMDGEREIKVEYTDEAPKYWDNSTNSTLAGEPVEFRLRWTDEVGLAGHVFSMCNGTWNGTQCSEEYWWNYSFQKCRNITLSTALNDYQYKLTLNATNFDYSYTNDSGNDIRIVNASCGSGGQEMHYWIEKWNESGDSVVWFRGDNQSTTTYSVYYNYTEAESKSNGADTFLFFDDFITNTTDQYWRHEFNGGGGYYYIRNDTGDSDRRIRWKSKLEDINSRNWGGNWGGGATNDNSTTQSDYISINMFYNTDVNGTETQPGVSMTCSADGIQTSTARYTVTTEGSEYLYELRIQSGIRTEGQIWNLNFDSQWSTSITTNVPTNLQYQYIRHYDYHNQGYCYDERFEWLSSDERLRSYVEGSHYGCDSWIDNRIDWWVVSRYNSSEPSPILGSEENFNYNIWINDSWTEMTGTGNWSNVTKVINDTIGSWIAWRVYANDSSGKWNVSEVYSFIAVGFYGLNGKVLYWDNATAVPGAYVLGKIYDGNRLLGQGYATTNSSGYYTLKIPVVLGDNRRYLANITATKDSYQSYLKHYFRVGA